MQRRTQNVILFLGDLYLYYSWRSRSLVYLILKFQLLDCKCYCNCFDVYFILRVRDVFGSDNQIYKVEYLYWMEEFMY